MMKRNCGFNRGVSKNDGYIVHKFYNGIDALECIKSQKMDLAILDVMLPDVDGFHICQK